MRSSRFTALVAIAAIVAAVYPPATHAETCVAVEVQNVRAGAGPLKVAAYVSEETFNKTAATSMSLTAAKETLSFQLCVPDSKVVALRMYQDANDNGKLDASVLGIPSEPYGASGTPVFGPPTWGSASVPLDGRPLVVKLSK